MNPHDLFFKTYSFGGIMVALRLNFDDAIFEVKTKQDDNSDDRRPRREMIVVTVPRCARVEFTLNGITTDKVVRDKSHVIDVNVDFQSYNLVNKRCNYRHEFSWYMGPDTTVKAWNNFMTSCRSWHRVVRTPDRERWYGQLRLWNHKSLDEVTALNFTSKSRWAKKVGLAEASVEPFMPDSQLFTVEVQKNVIVAAGVVGIVNVNEDSFLSPADGQAINPWFLIQCRVGTGTRSCIVYDGKNSYYRASPDSGVHKLCVDSCEPFIDLLSVSDKTFLDEIIGLWLEGKDQQLLTGETT